MILLNILKLDCKGSLEFIVTTPDAAQWTNQSSSKETWLSLARVWFELTTPGLSDILFCPLSSC